MDDAWNDVAEQFGAIGSLFKEHYDNQETGQEEDPEVTQEQLDAAVSKLKTSLEAAVETAGDAVKDPNLKEGAREGAASVLDAIGVTFSEVGGEVSKQKE